MTLYEIDEAILSAVDQETGEIIDEEKLNALLIERDYKIENIGCWIKNLNAEAKALKEEIGNLTNRKKAAENKVESLKNYLAAALAGDKFKSAKVSISYRKSDSVDITDLSLIPDEFLKYKDPDPDKAAIKTLLKNGQAVPGAKLIESNNIQIK